MNQQYDNTNRGVLFKNDRKSAESQPDYKGQINVGGQEFWLSAWLKDGQKGKFMSLSVTPKEDQAPPPRQQAQPGRQPSRPQPQQNTGSGWDEDPPF